MHTEVQRACAHLLLHARGHSMRARLPSAEIFPVTSPSSRKTEQITAAALNPAVTLPTAVVQNSVHTHPALPRAELQGRHLQRLAASNTRAARQLRERAGELQVSEG